MKHLQQCGTWALWAPGLAHCGQQPRPRASTHARGSRQTLPGPRFLGPSGNGRQQPAQFGRHPTYAAPRPRKRSPSEPLYPPGLGAHRANQVPMGLGTTGLQWFKGAGRGHWDCALHKTALTQADFGSTGAMGQRICNYFWALLAHETHETRKCLTVSHKTYDEVFLFGTRRIINVAFLQHAIFP